MSDKLFDQALRDWLEDGSDRTPPPAIDAVLLAVKTTPQERDLRIPWRFIQMPTYMRLAAGIAIVAVLGVGALLLANRGPIVGPQITLGPTTSAPIPSSKTTTPTPSPAPSQVARGIAGWTTYTSEVHGYTLGYPEDWKLEWAATREWRAGDTVLEAATARYADVFSAPEADTIGLFVWEMPAGEGADVESVGGLKAWAETFCNDVGESSCADFTQRAEAMCLDAGGDSCRAALLVPTAGAQYAFFVDWESALLTSVPDRVRVVQVAREDGFPGAARYGGTVALLRSILVTMDVT